LLSRTRPLMNTRIISPDLYPTPSVPNHP